MLFSCEEEGTIQPNNIVTSNQTFLQIEDVSEIQTLLERAGNYETYETLLAENPSFKSYHTLYEAEMKALSEAVDSNGFRISDSALGRYYKTLVVDEDDATEDKEVNPSIKVLSLRRILNEDGVIQIEDVLYQYTPEVMYYAPIIDIQDFEDLSSTPGVKSEPYIISGLTKARRIEGICTDTYLYNNTWHRLKPRWYSDKFKVGKVDFRDVWIEIKHQKRGAFNFWYANEEDRIWTSGLMRVAQPPGSQFSSQLFGVFNSRNNASSLERTIDTDPLAYPLSSNPTDWVISTSNVDHRSEDGAASADCRIIQ